MDKVCTFQTEREVITKTHILALDETKNVFSCALTVGGRYADWWEYCNPEKCPLYQTWQLLQRKPQ